MESALYGIYALYYGIYELFLYQKTHSFATLTRSFSDTPTTRA